MFQTTIRNLASLGQLKSQKHRVVYHIHIISKFKNVKPCDSLVCKTFGTYVLSGPGFTKMLICRDSKQILNGLPTENTYNFLNFNYQSALISKISRETEVPVNPGGSHSKPQGDTEVLSIE